MNTDWWINSMNWRNTPERATKADLHPASAGCGSFFMSNFEVSIGMITKKPTQPYGCFVTSTHNLTTILLLEWTKWLKHWWIY
jgi:hypothetical protein